MSRRRSGTAEVNKARPRGWSRHRRRAQSRARRRGRAAGIFVIESTSRARDGLYLRIMEGASGRLQKVHGDGRVTDIALPSPAPGAVYTVRQ